MAKKTRPHKLTIQETYTVERNFLLDDHISNDDLNYLEENCSKSADFDNALGYCSVKLLSLDKYPGDIGSAKYEMKILEHRPASPFEDKNLPGILTSRQLKQRFDSQMAVELLRISGQSAVGYLTAYDIMSDTYTFVPCSTSGMPLLASWSDMKEITLDVHNYGQLWVCQKHHFPQNMFEIIYSGAKALIAQLELYENFDDLEERILERLKTFEFPENLSEERDLHLLIWMRVCLLAPNRSAATDFVTECIIRFHGLEFPTKERVK